MKRKPMLILVLGIILIVVAVGGAVQLRARRQFLTRGWETGFPAPLPDTELPRACVNAALEQYDAEHLAWALDTITAGGFAWVRQRFAWAAIEPTPGDFHWEAWDVLVAAAKTRDLRLIAVLDTAPAWAGMPPEPAAFAHFAGAFAARYGDTFTYYQIWHNPNLGDAWGGYADAYAYTELLAGAADAIRTADTDARIVLGGLAPTIETGERNYAEDVFLEMLYVAGAQPYFDVVATQPYGFSAAPEERAVGRDVFTFSRAILVRETLEAHGDGNKAVWASHFGWNSKPAGWPGPTSIWGSVDETTQADYTVAALARAEREWPWMGVMCVNGFQPRPESGVAGAVPDAEEHWGFALLGPDGEPRPVYAALQAWNTRPRVATPGGYNAGTSLANFDGTWTRGPQGADIGQSGDRVTLAFEGTGVALTVRRGPYRAFLFVTVDGEPAPALPRDRQGHAYVVLYDPLAAVATVPLAENLPYGRHTVEVVAERGWGQWALADWRVANQPETAGDARGYAVLAVLGVGGLTLAVLAGRRVDWGRLGQNGRRLWCRLREGGQIMLAGVLSAIYLFAAWRVMMGEGVFRRLGDGGESVVLLLAVGMYYFSPWLLLTLGAGVLVSLIVFMRPALGLMLTMFAAPLYMHPLSLLGKSFSLAELVLLPTLLGSLVHIVGMLKDGKRLHLPRRQVLLVTAFVAVALLSTLWADNRHVALRELRLVILEPALFYLALIALPLEKHERWRILDAWVGSAVMVAGVGLVQYFLLGDVITAEGGMQRLRSLYGSPNNVGLYLGRALPLMLAVVFFSSGARSNGNGFSRSGTAMQVRRRLYALACVPVGVALLLSLSRGAIVLGVPAALLVLGILGGPQWRRATAVVLLLGVVAMIPLLRTPRFAGMFDLSGGTTGFRLALWHSAWGMIRAHPLLGVGPDNFLYAYRTRYVLPTAWEEFNLAHPHNVVMDFAARLGILGLMTFVGLQVSFWRQVWPLRTSANPELRALALGVMASMADFLAHGMVDASYFVIDLAFVFFLSLALGVWLEEDQSATSKLI
ncbi:MAG TPA: O-antigen ligase family protein [Anaerolineae bacterium]|nr:O-antigen ligase family protein [Anaerolineae bacterium]HQH39056.1 O-antigen ligase family protein [Anaerolineae bacterium]